MTSNLNAKNQLHLLTGALASSIGSQALFIVITALMPAYGFSLIQVALFVATGRLTGLVSTFFLGELSNRFVPRRLILWSEIFGLFASILILATWNLGPAGFPFLILAMIVRSTALAVQVPSRTHLIKAWNKNDSNLEMRGAIWLNKVSQGALFFSALLSIPLVLSKNIALAVAIDIASFAVNGVLLLFFINEHETDLPSGQPVARPGYFEKFKTFYTKTPGLASLDFALVAGTMGINTLFVKLAGGASLITTALHVTFGAMVWVTGYLYRVEKIRTLDVSPWWLAACGLFLLSFATQASWVLMILGFSLVFGNYWILFHRFTAEVQANFSTDDIAGVTSARMIQINIMVIVGEMAVAGIAAWIDSATELTIRAAFFSMVALALSLRKLTYAAPVKV